MSNQLSDRINKVTPSATLEMAAKARELRASGKDIIGLSLGEPDFNTPDYIKDAAIQAVNDNYNSYTPVDGYQDLKQAIITKFKRDNNLKFDATQIVVSTGAKQALYNVAQVCLNKGDEVILPCPYWVSYSDIVKLADGVPVEVPTSIESDFKNVEWVDIPAAIERNDNSGIQEITKQILNNPDVVWGASFMVSRTEHDHPTKIVEDFYPLFKRTK